MDILPALKRLLQEIAQTVEARGLLPQIDLEFVVHLVPLCKLFGETKLLPDMLQTDSLSLVSTYPFKNYGLLLISFWHFFGRPISLYPIYSIPLKLYYCNA